MMGMMGKMGKMPANRTILWLLIALGALGSSLGAEERKVRLRYDLRPGDHLVYRQIWEQERKGPNQTRTVRLEWENHLLVTTGSGGRWAVGMQRNRIHAELGLAQDQYGAPSVEERKRFEERLARRPSRFAEANWVSDRGQPGFPWQVIREWPSRFLYGLHELETLPESPVGPGAVWSGGNLLGLDYRVVGWESVNDQECLKIEGTAQNDSMHLSYWFCPTNGTLEKLEFEGNLPGFGRNQVREKLTLQLLERRRNEKRSAWFTRPALQQATLAVMMTGGALPITSQALYGLLESKDTQFQHRLLAMAYRHRLPPPLERMASLLESEDVRVRRLAVRLLEQTSRSLAEDWIRHALDDPDFFVRQAALDWVQTRLPVEHRGDVTTPEEARAAWERLSEVPVQGGDEGVFSALTARIQERQVLPEWNCGESNDWARRVIGSRRLPLQPLGTTLRGMRSEKYRGWPFVMHVPADYRGDKPFPLLIYLSGGPGWAMLGLRGAEDLFSELGYLVVLPDAGNQYWWRERPSGMVSVLIDEILRDFNVDTNSVYVAGSSNGGSGALYFASWWPHRFASVVPLMGHGIFPPDRGEPARLANVRGLPMLFLHGDNDQVVSVLSTQRTVEALQREEGATQIQIEIFKGRGHDLGLGRDDGRTLAYLQGRRRDPFPRRIRFQTADLRFPRHYWVEILEKGSGLAEVNGFIEKDNTVRLTTRKVERLRLMLRRELFPLDGPLRIRINGKVVFSGALAEDCRLLQESWIETADPFLAHSVELEFDVP